MHRRVLLFVIASVIAISSFFGILSRPSYADASLDNQIQAYIYYHALEGCMYVRQLSSGGRHDYITPGDADAGVWFRNDFFVSEKVVANVYKSGDGALTNCGDSGFITSAIKFFGYTSGSYMLQDLGFTVDRGNYVNGALVSNTGSVVNTMRQKLESQLGFTIPATPLSGAIGYIYYSNEFRQACGATAVSVSQPALVGRSLGLQEFDPSGAPITTVYNVPSLVANEYVWTQYNGKPENKQMTCQQIGDAANSNFAAYQQWQQANPPGSAGNPGTCEQYVTVKMGGAAAVKADNTTYTMLLAACQDGSSNKSVANYCATQYPAGGTSDPTQQAQRAACIYGYGTVGQSTTATAVSGKSNCGIDGIGWVVCPVMNFLADVNDKAYNFLASTFLSVNTGLVTGVQPAWSQFRDIANILFVIAFLFVIYSQITSMGISNYGIKRMLPRIVVAALLVNLSFYICQIAVDVSNILGYGVVNFFNNTQIGTTTLGGGLSDNGGNANYALGWVAIIGGSLGILAGGVGIALSVSVPLILASILAIGMIVLIMIGRQALIVLLVAISPLAFVAYLLPNTEQWFKKWYKAFSTLLLLFPIIAVVFAASRLAAKIIAGLPPVGNTDPNVMKLVALGVSVIPFFVVPGLLKGSLNAIGSLGAKMQGLSDKATGRVTNSAKKKAAERTQPFTDALAHRKQERAVRRARGIGTSRVRRFGLGVIGGKGYSGKLANRASQLENKEFEEDVSAAEETHKGMLNSDIEAIALGKKGGTEAERVAAVRKIMKDGNHEQRMAVLASSSTQSERAKQSIRDGAYAKNMHSYLGGGIGDSIMNGEIKGEADLDQKIAETAEAGKLTAEGLVGDGTAVNRIATVLSDSESGKRTFMLDQLDAAGKPVINPATGKPVKVARKVSRTRVDGAKQAATTAKSTPATRAKIADNMSASIDQIEAL